jgi:hypothetical protein
VAVCVGVGKLSVALNELNCTIAATESVALTDTVVTVVIWVEVIAVEASMAMYVK